MSESDKANLDQQLAQLRDGLPRFWFAIYQGCLDAGFSEAQAMLIVLEFVRKN
jgi:hypothetical protein